MVSATTGDLPVIEESIGGALLGLDCSYGGVLWVLWLEVFPVIAVHFGMLWVLDASGKSWRCQGMGSLEPMKKHFLWHI